MHTVREKETKGTERRTKMNNVMEMVDSCMNAQKDFMNSCVNAQKDGMERWTEATMKLQEPLLNMGGTPAGPMKDMMGFYKSCLTTMMNSTKTVAEESGKMQDAWKSAVEKQMEMSREMMQKMTVFFQPMGVQK